MPVKKSDISDRDDENDDDYDDLPDESANEALADAEEEGEGGGSPVEKVGEVSVGGGAGGLRNMVLLGAFILIGFWMLVSMLTGGSSDSYQP